ncbi:MAG: hypothetical protein J5494_06805 [Candidatus Methanomethylophilaceae archaeon]|nr:hypothetical protein [Candidatus Methanomethylophilaceae archaeon]
MKTEAIGMRGETPFEEIISHFTSLGGEAVLVNPDRICGKNHLLSSYMHAERAFSSGTNRSRNIVTETIMYCAWERQAGTAILKMRPDGSGRYAALLIGIEDPRLDEIGMIRDDSLLEASERKAELLDLRDPFLGAEEQALERVAMTDLLKYRYRE